MHMMDVWIVKFHREVGESLKNYIGAVHMTYFGLFLFIHLFFYLFILHMTKVSHMMLSMRI